jgi:hypothetical protein
MPRPSPNEVIAFTMTREQAAQLSSLFAIGHLVLQRPDNFAQVLTPREAIAFSVALSNLAGVGVEQAPSVEIYRKALLNSQKIKHLTQQFAVESVKLYAPEDMVDEICRMFPRPTRG